MRWIISSVVTESGKPVLAVPPATKKLDVTGEALVAWNGSPPVAETLRAAVPLLSLAAGVQILQIGEAEGENARSEEHTSELKSPMRNSYAVFCLTKKKKRTND